jgi:hypothetical protein
VIKGAEELLLVLLIFLSLSAELRFCLSLVSCLSYILFILSPKGSIRLIILGALHIY